jgi:hypothetical protein
MQYRCSAHRCLLLDAIAIMDTILLHQQRYKHSESVNQCRSNAAGRTRNTFGEGTHWKPRSYFIGNSALAHPDDIPPQQLAIQCDHVGVTPNGAIATLLATDFHSDWQAGHTEIAMRRNGTRYAVRGTLSTAYGPKRGPPWSWRTGI